MLNHFRGRQLLFLFLSLLLLIGSVSCANSMSSTARTVPTPTPVSRQKTPIVATNMAANTDCPISGKGRAANMPEIALGSRQQIISYRNANGSATLRGFDVQDRTASTITSIGGETIDGAQLSQSGQWVLIVAQKKGVWALQLIRVDGKDFQTLYCTSTGQKLVAQWSPNQQQIIFSQVSGQNAQLLLLNPTTGVIQVEYVLTHAYDEALEPITWLDSSHVYIGLVSTSTGSLYKPEDLFVLDTRKGANQQPSDLTTVLGIGDTPWSFDCSLDGTTAYFTTSKEPPRADVLQSVIYASPALSGGFTHPIFTSHTLFITAVRVINATTLMIVVQDPENTHSSANGLYTMRTDGSGLKQLVSSSKSSPWAFNAFSQYTWSSFSRDGAYYVDGLSYGSFSGGPLTVYASALDNDALVGWTTK